MAQNNGIATSRFGVVAVRESSVELVGGNTVRSNNRGVFLQSSTLRTGPGDVAITPMTNDISVNNTFGILTGENATVDLRDGVTITNNGSTGIVQEHGGRMRIQATTVSGNGGHGIFADSGSTMRLLAPKPSVTGNVAFGLFCAVAESSVAGYASGITGNGFGNVSCTGF